MILGVPCWDLVKNVFVDTYVQHVENLTETQTTTGAKWDLFGNERFLFVHMYDKLFFILYQKQSHGCNRMNETTSAWLQSDERNDLQLLGNQSK